MNTKRNRSKITLKEKADLAYKSITKKLPKAYNLSMANLRKGMSQMYISGFQSGEYHALRKEWLDACDVYDLAKSQIEKIGNKYYKSMALAELKKTPIMRFLGIGRGDVDTPSKAVLNSFNWGSSLAGVNVWDEIYKGLVKSENT